MLPEQVVEDIIAQRRGGATFKAIADDLHALSDPLLDTVSRRPPPARLRLDDVKHLAWWRAGVGWSSPEQPRNSHATSPSAWHRRRWPRQPTAPEALDPINESPQAVPTSRSSTLTCSTRSSSRSRAEGVEGRGHRSRPGAAVRRASLSVSLSERSASSTYTRRTQTTRDASSHRRPQLSEATRPDPSCYRRTWKDYRQPQTPGPSGKPAAARSSVVRGRPARSHVRASQEIDVRVEDRPGDADIWLRRVPANDPGGVE